MITYCTVGVSLSPSVLYATHTLLQCIPIYGHGSRGVGEFWYFVVVQFLGFPKGTPPYIPGGQVDTVTHMFVYIVYIHTCVYTLGWVYMYTLVYPTNGSHTLVYMYIYRETYAHYIHTCVYYTYWHVCIILYVHSCIHHE